MTKKQIVVFPDTNFFLHFEFFDQVNYSKILSDKIVYLIIAPQVTKELEEKKTLSNDKYLYERAFKVVKRLKEIRKEKVKIKDGTDVIFLKSEPTIDFSKYNLNSLISDDWFLASVIDYKQNNPERRVVILSNDSGIDIKCEGHQLECIDPADCISRREKHDLVSKKENELLKENEILLNKLKILESRIPNLLLTFEDEKIEKYLTLIEPMPINESSILEAQSYLSNKYRPITAILPNIPGFTQHSDYEIQEYNSAVRTYPQKALQYLKKFHESDVGGLITRIVPINLNLKNIGRVPGNNIDIFIFIEGKCAIYTAYPNIRKLDKAPKKPNNLKSSLIDYASMIPRKLAEITKNGPVIDHDSKISYWFHTLKHGVREQLDAFFIQLSCTENSEIIIKYEIAAENNPERQRGELKLRIEFNKAEPRWLEILQEAERRE